MRCVGGGRDLWRRVAGREGEQGEGGESRVRVWEGGGLGFLGGLG